MSDSAIEKRVKRHVMGPTQSFFAVTAPGLENLCYGELSAMPGTISQAEVISGGVAFKGRLPDMYRANLGLRTATRVLMRISRFKASNFRQMEKHLQEIPWELHVSSATRVAVSVTTSHSRLYHTAAIAERVENALRERLGGAARTREASEGRAVQQLLVRVLQDRFVLSLDSSGEPLYKRGLKENVGRAPLRETLAAAALTWAGYTGREPLMDPMCGSGTFSLEAALVANQIPPGWHRDFAFMNWPAFKEKQWLHLKNASSPAAAPLKSPYIFASDIDPGVCASLASVVRQHEFAPAVSVLERDFFDLEPGRLVRKPGVVALNPPYGVRLGSVTQARRRYAEIAAKLERDYRKWRVAVILPDRRLAKIFPAGLKQRKLTHGGLDLILLTGLIS